MISKQNIEDTGKYIIDEVNQSKLQLRQGRNYFLQGVGLGWLSWVAWYEMIIKTVLISTLIDL